MQRWHALTEPCTRSGVPWGAEKAPPAPGAYEIRLFQKHPPAVQSRWGLGARQTEPPGPCATLDLAIAPFHELARIVVAPTRVLEGAC